MLFDIALEPLARCLENTDLYDGVKVGSQQEKIALFADDVILFLSDPLKHLPDVFRTIAQFGKLSGSGFKLNVTISELLELSKPLPGHTWNQMGLHITPVSNHITYLGIKIGRAPDTFYGCNYPPLLSKIMGELKRWAHSPLSFLVRCHLIKTSAFS